MIDTHQTRCRQYLPTPYLGHQEAGLRIEDTLLCRRFQSLVQRTDHLRALPARIDMVDIMEPSKTLEVGIGRERPGQAWLMLASTKQQRNCDVTAYD